MVESSRCTCKTEEFRIHYYFFSIKKDTFIHFLITHKKYFLLEYIPSTHSIILNERVKLIILRCREILRKRLNVFSILANNPNPVKHRVGIVPKLFLKGIVILQGVCSYSRLGNQLVWSSYSLFHLIFKDKWNSYC